jgi:acyl carrier protein
VKEEAVQPHAQFGFDDLKRILVERVGVPEDHVKDDSSETFEDIGLDSLAFIELRTALEEDYGIEVRDEDVEHIYTLGDAIDYVNGRLAPQEPTQ